MVSELEARLEGHTANIESLTSTLKTKEEIITVSVNHTCIYTKKTATFLECNRRRVPKKSDTKSDFVEWFSAGAAPAFVSERGRPTASDPRSSLPTG